MKLLFTVAHWHALAKLRQHTDLSLDILESLTIRLGQSLRDFQEKTCAAYDTKELKREEAARIKRTANASTSCRLTISITVLYFLSPLFQYLQHQ